MVVATSTIVAGAVIGVFVLIIIIAVSVAVGLSLGAKRPRIVGYWANWINWLRFEQSDLDSMAGCTDCMYSFVTLAHINDADDPTRIPWNGTNLYGSSHALFGPDGIIGQGLSDEAAGAVVNIIAFCKNVKRAGKRAYIALGGWSDTQATPRLSEDTANGFKQLKDLGRMLVELLTHCDADGIDFDWEHLGSWYYGPGSSGPQPSIEDKVDRCAFMGALMTYLRRSAPQFTISYTSRSNGFVPYQHQWEQILLGADPVGAPAGNSDCEAVCTSLGCNIDITVHGPDKVPALLNTILAEYIKSVSPTKPYKIPNFIRSYDHFAMMTYDGAVGTIANGDAPGRGPDAIHNQYTVDEVKRVTLENQEVSGLDKHQILSGFEPVAQAAGGVPMTKETRDELLKWMHDNNRGGFILWAVNDNRVNFETGLACQEIASQATRLFYSREPTVTKVLKPYAYERDWGWGAGTTCIPFSPYNFDDKRGVFWNPVCRVD